MENKKRLYGLNLLLSMMVLFLEAALALVVSIVYEETQAAPTPEGTGGSPLFVLFLPVLAVIGATFTAAISLTLVLPTAWLSDALGRRFAGREAWWCVPPVAGALALAPVGTAVALAGGGKPGAIALGWSLTTVTIAVPAVLCRSRRKRIFGPVLLWGVLTVVVTAALGAAALSTGLLKEYRPPAVTSADLVGSWSDGNGGTLTLTPDSRVTGSGLHADLGYGSTGLGKNAPSGDHLSRDDDNSCTGPGTWSFEPGPDTTAQRVEITVGTCGVAPWSVGGTADRLTLYQYVGDPDAPDLHELTKAPGT
ncbi:hypothetical protein RI138_18800 [Streptomyces sp. C11-1]|uniref:Uncharacterized protein n=1 Tax=Streptomyces durocortorensis TaxID=2811104 RepID=A0ABY9W3W6_9ACTN|nr:hypothetical protein [Streptomyces durocortorensis]WNF28712.1 hypothetical protein RI138_18800 [Streptomyces durocortorensis]